MSDAVKDTHTFTSDGEVYNFAQDHSGGDPQFLYVWSETGGTSDTITITEFTTNETEVGGEIYLNTYFKSNNSYIDYDSFDTGEDQTITINSSANEVVAFEIYSFGASQVMMTITFSSDDVGTNQGG